MLSKLDPALAAPLDLKLLALNLLVGMIISVFLKYHYDKFSSVLSNRKQFSIVFPFITLVTILIITVVKSSLALSLGLVGALSIVRFRTPIKEPEELAYLFMTIAVGLGLGANQTKATVLSSFVILLFILIFKKFVNKSTDKNIYITVRANPKVSNSDFLKSVNDVISKNSAQAEVRRVDVKENNFFGVYFSNFQSSEHITNTLNQLNEIDKSIEVSIVDHQKLPTL
tara:strand:- start:111919 stop:112599 length:681 start_codon:yes stop_codon:yes gene_type:complete